MKQLTDKAIIALRNWIDFLDAQTAALDDQIYRRNGRRFQADEHSATYLALDNGLFREHIEKSVFHSIRYGGWPELSFAELRLLLLRMFTARDLIVALVNQDTDVSRCTPPLPDDVADKPKIVRWLLIDHWNVARGEALKAIIGIASKCRNAVSRSSALMGSPTRPRAKKTLCGVGRERE